MTVAQRALRNFFAALALLLPLSTLGPNSAAAAAATREEAYISSISDQAIGILTDKGLDRAGRFQKFHKLILDNIDLDQIAAFALGRYAGAMRSTGRYDEYKGLFGDYIARVYASRLSSYSGEHVKLQKTMSHGNSDTIVFSTIEPGAEGGDPIAVNWRLTERDKQLKIKDVQIVGAWMSIEQQSQFSSIIASNNRDVSKLLDYLKQQTNAPPPGKA